MAQKFVLWDIDRAKIDSTPNTKMTLLAIAKDRHAIIPAPSKEARA